MKPHLYNETWSKWSTLGKKSKHLEGDFERIKAANISCGDEVVFEIKHKNNRFISIGFTSKGCSICLATSAFLAEYLEAKDFKTAQNDLIQLEKFIQNEDENNLIKDFELFSLLHLYPTRTGCVFLNTKTLLKFIKATLNRDK